MSVELISWSLQQAIPSGPKFVLVALSNRAGHNGECWPSEADLSFQTSKDARTVRRHIRWLVKEGFIRKYSRRRPNGSFSSNSFVIQRTNLQELDFPSGQIEPQGANDDKIKTFKKQKVKKAPQKSPEDKMSGPEPSLKKKNESSVDIPEGLDPQLWKDFLLVRKQKRLPLTPTGWKGLEREAKKAGWSIEKVVRECVERGWGGFKAEWILPKTGGFQRQEPPRKSNPQVDLLDFAS